jgi:hypothetical protein
MAYYPITPYFNYDILNNLLSDNDYDYTDLYDKRINEFFNTYKKKVKTSFFQTVVKKKDQRKHIIRNYIIPISYLLYSYIYTKYYNLQLKKEIKNESDTIYEMYGFLFNI